MRLIVQNEREVLCSLFSVLCSLFAVLCSPFLRCYYAAPRFATALPCVFIHYGLLLWLLLRRRLLALFAFWKDFGGMFTVEMRFSLNPSRLSALLLSIGTGLQGCGAGCLFYGGYYFPHKKTEYIFLYDFNLNLTGKITLASAAMLLCFHPVVLYTRLCI